MKAITRAQQSIKFAVMNEIMQKAGQITNEQAAGATSPGRRSSISCGATNNHSLFQTTSSLQRVF